MAKSKEPASTMEGIGMDMSDFYDTDLIKPTKKK